MTFSLAEIAFHRVWMPFIFLVFPSLNRTLAAPKVLTLGKTQIFLVFPSLNCTFAPENFYRHIIMKKRICILGSTGSIGTQALDVIGQHEDLYEAYVLTAYNNADLLIEQARKYNPEAVVIAKESNYGRVKEGLEDLPIKVYAGADALCQVVQDDNVDIVLASMVGFAGLEPTIAAIDAGKDIALANKETLVAAGEIVMRRAKERGVKILPVDSEHGAFFQCLGEKEFTSRSGIYVNETFPIIDIRF